MAEEQTPVRELVQALERLRTERKEKVDNLMHVAMPPDAKKPTEFRVAECDTDSETPIRLSYFAKEEKTGQRYHCNIGYLNGAHWLTRNVEVAPSKDRDITLKQGEKYAAIFAQKLRGRVLANPGLVKEIKELDTRIHKATSALEDKLPRMARSGKFLY